MFASTLVAFVPALAVPVQDGVVGQVEIPGVFIEGQPFEVEVVYVAGEQGAALAPWRLGAAAFEADGLPLAVRPSGDPIELPAGSSLTLKLDLSPHLAGRGAFRLSVFGGGDDTGRQVNAFGAVAPGLDFMTVPAERLGEHVVLLQTNKGDIIVELWPDVAPNHVRNFLDLAYTGFYDGILFHRVSPEFMIQGGCPNTKTDRQNTWGTGSGPRMLDAEFSDTKHVRGVLSMARGPSPNSASSQFFLMTADSLFLDGDYSAFGKMISGFDALDRIARARGRKGSDRTVRPDEPQKILKAIVLARPSAD